MQLRRPELRAGAQDVLAFMHMQQAVTNPGIHHTGVKTTMRQGALSSIRRSKITQQVTCGMMLIFNFPIEGCRTDWPLRTIPAIGSAVPPLAVACAGTLWHPTTLRCLAYDLCEVLPAHILFNPQDLAKVDGKHEKRRPAEIFVSCSNMPRLRHQHDDSDHAGPHASRSRYRITWRNARHSIRATSGSGQRRFQHSRPAGHWQLVQ